MTKPRKRRTQSQLLKADEIRVQRLSARLQQKQIKAALSYYAAADKGRKNRDWKASAVSADQAIIPDQPVITARARHTIANTWIGKAALRSHLRNVVGRGIEVVPVAKDDSGEELSDLNAIAASVWGKWACSFKDCDVEKKRTFYEFQRSFAAEEFATGIGLAAWSYSFNPTNVGLRLKLYEYEQLDTTIQRFGENEVRSGVEVDQDGAAVAYHFYPRNPNDYLAGTRLKSNRIPADQVLVFFDPERVRQTIGVSHLAPVLQDTRDYSRSKDALLWRLYMESCIGMGIKRNAPTVGSNPLTFTRQTGDTGQTASGMRTADFVPGMIYEAAPGEELTPFIPTTPGNQYEPFTNLTLRGIGAGIGQSFGSLTRHNDANYSAARQDMLEDERELSPKQDSLIDHVILQIYELFYQFAVMEGRLPVTLLEYMEGRDRLVDAEYIAPARPWIDPEKEANAYGRAIELRIITRKEIIAQRGGRYQNVIRQIAAERDEAAEVDIEFEEDKAPPAPQQKQPQDQTLRKLAVLDSPPDYRPSQTDQRCATCRYMADGQCSAFNMKTGDYFVCNDFEPTVRAMPANVPKEGAGIETDSARSTV